MYTQRNQLPKEHCFYSQIKSFEQSKLYLLLHIHYQIPIDVIIKCVEVYVSMHSGLQGNSSNRDRKRYSKPKAMEELKSFRLSCIYCSDAWVDHLGEFLKIVSDETKIVFPDSLTIKRNIIPNLLNLKY